MLDRNEVAAKCLSGNALAPVMSLYMVGKPLAISPAVVQSVQEQWSRAVMSAVSIICVGVRPNPPDRHIWEPLAATGAPLYYVGDALSFSDWQRSVGKPGCVFLGDRFSTSYFEIVRTARSHAVE